MSFTIAPDELQNLLVIRYGGHAWVEWETAQGTFLLDPTLNWTATLTDLQDKSTYIPLYAFAGGHKYRAYNPALMTAQDSWSHQVAARD